MADTTTTDSVSDIGVAEFLDMARSAHVYFDLTRDKLSVRAVDPIWQIWTPVRHLLDEIGTSRIEAYLRSTAKPS